ncbi:MAG: RNA-binding protein, partial [Candidatus Micrarchaeota archaeon]|nr:RNA-binding protein [Candidatus Micrarchaeota archaeon]
TAFDIHMNIVLDSAEEHEDGNLKTKIGTILLRGGNILWVAPA